MEFYFFKRNYSNSEITSSATQKNSTTWGLLRCLNFVFVLLSHYLGVIWIFYPCKPTRLACFDFFAELRPVKVGAILKYKLIEPSEWV